MKKRIASLLLIVCLLGSLWSPLSLTASAATYSGSCGTNASWSLDTGTGILTISGTGEMKNYLLYQAPWLTFNEEITSVKISSGITSIGNSAFFYCKELTSVTIPNSVTTIGECAFNCCFSLTNVTIPKGVTTIAYSAFSNCTDLKSVTIPNSVTTIDNYAFADCHSLTTVTIPNSVTTIGHFAFVRCTNLTGVTIPNSVTTIGNAAFNYCTSLTGVTIPNSVTTIGNYVFEGCSSLTGITIPNSITTIGEKMFEMCKSLTSVTIPSNITTLDNGVFRDCNSLAKVTILNPNCSIYSAEDTLGVAGKTVIYGYPGSTAERYAKEYGYTVNYNVEEGARAPVTITKQPVSVTVARGATAKVSLTATGDGLSYKWYYKNKGASSFSYTSSFTSNSYSVAMNNSRNGRQVYCVVTDKYGNSVRSNTVTLKMKATVTITKQPSSVTVARGATAKVSLTATGDSLTYKWYYKNGNASSFSYTSSFKGNSYSVAMDASRNGRQVYCVVTDKNGNSVRSNTVTLRMTGAVAITEQPASVTVASGATAKVSLTATGSGLTYKWYYKNVGSSSFSYTSSFKGNSYSVTMNSSRNGRQIYCVVTDKYGNSVRSNTVTLRMTGAVAITEQPASVTVASGATAKVSLTATGDGLTYKWYYKNGNASSFNYTSSFKGNSYSVAMNGSRNGRQVYCVVTDKYGNSVRSNTVTLKMTGAVAITKQPASVTVTNGTTAKVSLTATGDGLTYKWYYKNAGASSFSYTSSFKGNSYSVTMNSSRSGRQVYCVVTDKYGNSVRSDTVTLKGK